MAALGPSSHFLARRRQDGATFATLLTHFKWEPPHTTTPHHTKHPHPRSTPRYAHLHEALRGKASCCLVLRGIATHASYCCASRGIARHYGHCRCRRVTRGKTWQRRSYPVLPGPTWPCLVGQGNTVCCVAGPWATSIVRLLSRGRSHPPRLDHSQCPPPRASPSCTIFAQRAYASLGLRCDENIHEGKGVAGSPRCTRWCALSISEIGWMGDGAQ